MRTKILYETAICPDFSVANHTSKCFHNKGSREEPFATVLKDQRLSELKKLKHV